MTDEDELIMARLGITSETRTIFKFQGHRYERLSDAVAYAEKRQTTPQRSEHPDPQ